MLRVIDKGLVGAMPADRHLVPLVLAAIAAVQLVAPLVSYDMAVWTFLDRMGIHDPGRAKVLSLCVTSTAFVVSLIVARRWDQQLAQADQRAAAMADGVLVTGAQLSKTQPIPVVGIKQRVVPESPLPAEFDADLTETLTFDGTPARSIDEREHTAETSASIGLAAQLVEQQAIVGLSGRFDGEPSRMDPGEPSQGLDLQPTVIGERHQTRALPRPRCLEQRVSVECVGVLRRLVLHPQLRQADPVDVGPNGAHLQDLVGIVGSQDKPHPAALTRR